MKRLNYLCIAMLFLTLAMPSCKKDYGNLNSPTLEDYSNATKDQLDNLVTGSLSGMRLTEGLYLDVVGVLGREMYRFSNSDPRYVTELMGSAPLNNTGFYVTNEWSARYRVVKNCNVLIDAANKSTYIPDDQKKGYSGFAKTLKAYELLMNLNLTYSNGIRIDVADPDNLGPILSYDASIEAIASLLDEAKTELDGATIVFPLSSGFAANIDLVQFNRALASRVDVYRQLWSAALTDLDASFLNLNGDFSTGVYEVFGTGSGDQLNPAYTPRNSNGEWRLAHPSYAADIESGDDRINKAP
jgi:hypothetical protein